MRYLMRFSYDGSKFYGFQRQSKVRTVQKELETALSEVLKQDIKIKGAGRTDKGVHAQNQTAHFDVDCNIINLKKELNSKIKDIKIKSIKKVSLDFHARYSVKEKKYSYKISYNCHDDENYYYYLRKKINIKKIKTAAKYFVGTHNFKNFTSGKRSDYQTTIYKVKIKKWGSKIVISFIGIGFYRYMVRNLVGALIDVGKNKIEPEVIKKMIDNPEIPKQLSTVLPNGLYLNVIKY